MSLFLINSRQVEAMCRGGTRKRDGLIQTPSAKAAVAIRTPAGPSINFDDVPETVLGTRQKNGKLSQKHQPWRFDTVVEEDDEDEEWPVRYNDKLSTEFEQSAESQWPCAFCSFLNHTLVSVCEMCEQHRDSPAPPTSLTCEADVAAVPASKSTIVLGRKWPSLQQATEKTWDLCEQSSLASSAVDIANLADIGVSNEDTTLTLELVDPTTVHSAELYDIFSDTGSCLASEEHGDTSSMASWCHIATSSEASKANRQGENVSVASWVDVGNLADFDADPEKAFCSEASPVASWLHCVEQSNLMPKPVTLPQDHVKTREAPGTAKWSSVVSETGSKGMNRVPSRSGVPMPPLTRRQVPRKKAAAREIEDEDDQEFFDDQDGRGRGRSCRQYRRRR